MSSKQISLKEFAALDEEGKQKALAEFLGDGKRPGLAESLKRLRRELDALELEHGVTTEEMLSPHSCSELESDPLLRKWSTAYAAYRELLVAWMRR